MKTTIDLPEEILHRAKVVAAQRRITLKDLIIGGLDWVTRPEVPPPSHQAALKRLQTGLRLGGKPLSRIKSHERKQVS